MARRPQLPGDDAESEASRLIELIRSTVPPMHPAGVPFVSAGLAVAAVGRRHRWVRTAGLSAAGACALFFRHPARVPPDRSGVVVAPADGQITCAATDVHGRLWHRSWSGSNWADWQGVSIPSLTNSTTSSNCSRVRSR